MDRQEAIYTGDIAMAMMRLAGEIPHGKDAVVQRFDYILRVGTKSPGGPFAQGPH